MPHSIDDLLTIMRRLRDPEHGCPWDRKQTFSTIAPYTIEEAYEVADAIDRGDIQELREELGDLLFQVVFYAQMAQETQIFSFADIVNAICEKMIGRHPHVFADVEYTSDHELRSAWDRHKQREREDKAEHDASILAGVARALPALMRAEKLQQRAARVGFDWPDIGGVIEKCKEELSEVETELESQRNSSEIHQELGDLLFSCVNLARHAGVNAEQALRSANEKFERRFRAVESTLTTKGRRFEDTDLQELDRLWDEVKQHEDAKRS
jgi:ATP diphosphatase